MRVVHLIKATQIGGAERHLLTLLPLLHQRGCEVHLVVLVEPHQPMAAMFAELQALNIPAERVVLGNRLTPWQVVWRLRGRFKALKPDLVHTHLIHADTFGVLAARLARVPTIIMSRHNDDAFRQRLFIRTLNRLLWRMAHGGIVISHALERFIMQYEHPKRAQLRVIWYGIPSQAASPHQAQRTRHRLRQMFNQPDSRLIVGMVCRLVEQKGISYGIRAFAQIASDFAADLVIVGDGPLRRALESETKRLGLADRVHFLGWRDDAAQLMAGFDVFLMPSLWEGFGLVLLEAMSQRIPIVASEISAIPEIVQHGETGLLVPPRHVTAFAQALRHLLSDDALRRHMGLLGEDRLETLFSAERMADETLAAYRTFHER